MTTTTQKAVAAGFLHALQDPDVLQKWQDCKGDSTKLRTLIKDTLGLSELPSEADLDAMKSHAESTLQAEHANMVAKQPKGPHVVGIAFSVQQ